MFDTLEAAAKEVERLGLAPVFREILAGRIPHVLRARCQQPHTYFRYCRDLAKLLPEIAALLPLYEQNGEAIVGRLPGGTYVRIYYEDARLKQEEAFEPFGNNDQQFATLILTETVEAGFWSDFDELASLLNYQHAQELRAILESTHDESRDLLLARFGDSIPSIHDA
jgi:hypothetical protein